MTAEVIVMNKNAVALAADSYVMLSSLLEQKGFLNNEKIFPLSAPHKVALMTHGEDFYAGIPWNTIFSHFDEQITNETPLATTEQYVEALLKFLATDKLIEQNQDPSFIVSDLVIEYGKELIKKQGVDHLADWGILQRVSEMAALLSASKATEDEVKEFNKDYLDKGMIPVEGLPENYESDFMTRYSADIVDSVREHFSWLKWDDSTYIGICRAICRMSKYWKPRTEYSSGIVIAGYGMRELFPSSFHIHCWTPFCNVPAYEVAERCLVGSETRFHNQAFVSTYAIDDPAQAFLKGIDPGYVKHLQHSLRDSLLAIKVARKDLPGVVADSFAELDHIRAKYANLIQSDDLEKLDLFKERLEQIDTNLNKVSDSLVDCYTDLTNYGQKNVYRPLKGVVQALPKADLASFAEALVTLVSLRRKLTMGHEGVGGPIDVAVISKEDGFVWVKKKSYFDPGLQG